MNQYTVLLVDDEEEVFQVIMKKLDWESMGFSIAGYARNGVEALEMALGARVSPMQTMTGPVTTGGRKRMTFFTPASLMIRARIR